MIQPTELVFSIEKAIYLFTGDDEPRRSFCFIANKDRLKPSPIE